MFRKGSKNFVPFEYFELGISLFTLVTVPVIFMIGKILWNYQNIILDDNQKYIKHSINRPLIYKNLMKTDFVLFNPRKTSDEKVLFPCDELYVLCIITIKLYC